ncbi:MAG: hypothetical protein JXX14_17735 [Deltaproteobacteria bacterium]|nr:hypothetical protein [Deltaproteobacteria bacterium]
MKTADTLFSRKPTTQDWLDSCVVGGAVLTDAINGAITDADIDPSVLHAFHSQYPNEVSFVDKIQEFKDDSEALQGLVSGVKGKLFETQYVDTLNSGGFLPEGHVAAMADSPVQPGWDVEIRDDHGQIVEQLQLKMTDSLSYVKESIERYPDFDIVLPTDVFQDLSTNADIAAHLVDSGIDSDQVMNPLIDNIDAVSDVGPDLIPELAFVFIAAGAAYSLYRGKDKKLVWKDTCSRANKTAIAGGLGGLAAFAIDPMVGLPVAMIARLAMSRHEVGKDFQNENTERVNRINKINIFVQNAKPQPKQPRYLQPSQLVLLAGDG